MSNPNKSESSLQVKFNFEQNKQKLLIHALLACNELSFESIALLLGVSSITLREVYNGEEYFHSEKAIHLMKIFLIRFTDQITFIELT